MKKSALCADLLPTYQEGNGQALQAFVRLAERLHQNSDFSCRSKTDHGLLESVLALEQYLGTSLLEAHGRAYKLSASGNLLLEYARRVLPERAEDKQGTPGTTQTRQRKFVSDQPADVAERLVSNTQELVERLVAADSSLFFWVDANGNMSDLHSKGVNLELLGCYESDVGRYDPLHISRLCAENKRIASLSHTRTQGTEICQHYSRHLIKLDVGDEVDLVFWQKERPVACMSFFRKIKAPCFSLDEFDWTALHERTQDFLNMHWRFRSGQIESALVNTFSLTPRELDVTEWLIAGKSNWDIAHILEISEATVKVHTASILKKLGVESRSGISAMISGL